MSFICVNVVESFLLVGVWLLVWLGCVLVELCSCGVVL